MMIKEKRDSKNPTASVIRTRVIDLETEVEKMKKNFEGNDSEKTKVRNQVAICEQQFKKANKING